MAFEYGFFNAALDSDSGEYDREYNADHITNFFEYIVGSGVCVEDNENSFLVTYSDGVARVAAGFLFINGRWFKNDSSYAIAMPESGTYAILATLDTTNRCFTLTYSSVADSYSDALCLACINVDSGTVTDTRDDTDICGEIYSLSEITQQMQEAIEYLGTEIEEEIESYLEDSQELVDEANALATAANTAAAALSAPAVGEIKYALQSPGSKWLECNGALIYSSDYSALVTLLNSLRGSGGSTWSGTYLYELGATQTLKAGFGRTFYLDGYVYFVSNGYLYRVDPESDSYKQLSSADRISVSLPSAASVIMMSYSNGYIFFGMANSDYSILYFAYGTFDAENFALTMVNDGTTGLCDVSYYAAGQYSACGEPYVYYDGTNVMIACRVFEDSTEATYPLIETWQAAFPPASSSSWTRGTSITYNMAFTKYVSKIGYSPVYGHDGNYIQVEAYKDSSSIYKIWMRSFPDNTISIVGDTGSSTYTDIFPYSGLTRAVTNGTYTVYAACANYSSGVLTGVTLYYTNNSSCTPSSITISKRYSYSSNLTYEVQHVFYARGVWFVVLKSNAIAANYLFYGTDITDSSSFSSLALNSLPLNSTGYYSAFNEINIDYDSTDECLIITAYGKVKLGRTTNPIPCMYFYKLSITYFVQTYLSGCYLPELSDSGFQGYIKALSG